MFFLLVFSDLFNMIDELTKERDKLLTTAEGLREKLNKAIATQQEIEAKRERAMENISQVKAFVSNNATHSKDHRFKTLLIMSVCNYIFK